MPLLPEKVYVTPDDFKNFFMGEDLRVLLSNNTNNESFAAESFIAGVTRSLKIWINRNTFRNFKWECMTPYQENSFKIGILYQCYYAWKEGLKAFGLDSGTDDERGTIIKKNDLMDVQVCQATIDVLSEAGIINFTMKNRPRVMRGYPGLEFWGTWPDGGGITGNN